MEETTSVEIPGAEEFVACDTCGHRSYVHFSLGGLPLSYCAHHGAMYYDKLFEKGEVVADYRESLKKVPVLA